jgi:uncharacterized protein YktA (UPF0223 family)
MINFINDVERISTTEEPPCSTLKQKHQMYRQIIQNQTEEKRIDEVLKKELGFSIYQILKRCEK